MSGGSFDYLYQQSPPDPEQLDAMASELTGLGYAEIATATLHAEASIAESDPLRDVWRAVEWWRSGDTSVASACAACDAYGGRREQTSYEQGWLDCLMLYAHMKDGVMYVGTTGRTRREAGVNFLLGRGFTDARAREIVG